MKKYIFYIFSIAPSLLQAQSLSIEQLWSSLSESNIAKQKQAELQLSKQNLLIEKLNRYPIVYGDLNIQRNLVVPTTPVPAIAFDPSAADDVYLPLKFATKWNSKAGLQLEWNVFAPTQRLKEKQQALAIKKAEIAEQENENQVKINATLAYTSIVLATLQYESSIEDSARYQQIVQIARLRYHEGRVTKEELLKTEQDLERKKIQIYESWSVLKEANYELLKYINLQGTENLSTNIDEIVLKLSSIPQKNYEAALLQQDLSGNELERTLIKKQLLPTLSINGYYGAQYFNNNINISNVKNWFGNSYLSLALRLPISDYLIQNKYLSKNLLETNLNNLKLEEILKNEDIKERQKLTKIQATELKIQSLKKIIQGAEEIVKNKQINYENGIVLISEYKRVLIDHNANLRELWQSQYDLISLLIN